MTKNNGKQNDYRCNFTVVTESNERKWNAECINLSVKNIVV